MSAFEDAAREMANLVRRVEQLESQLRTLRGQALRQDDQPPRTGYKVSEFARLIGKHPQTVRNMIADGRLDAVDAGGWWLIPVEVADAFTSVGAA